LFFLRRIDRVYGSFPEKGRAREREREKESETAILARGIRPG
jgi:hypothetical protein